MRKILLLISLVLILFISYINVFYFNKFKLLLNEDDIILKEEVKIEIIDNNDNKEKIEYNYIENQVGFIKIDGTNIDSKVMQYTDNDYFLTHDENGNYSIFGSIYMDYRNNVDDQKILIFGHNTKNVKTSPFKELEKYGNEDFYKKNSIIDLELYGVKYQYKIFSVIVNTDKNNKHMKLYFKNDDWINHLKWLKDDSIYDTNVDVNPQDYVITLQTCYYNPDNSLIIISAKRI